MELITPRMLWLLGLLAPLVVLYILKVKRARLRVGSTWLWREAQRDLMARSPFKRLVPQLPLLLQAAALIALAIAAAQPATRGKAVTGDHLAIIIDTSASMAATDPTGKTRIDLAKEVARELIAGVEPGSDVILFDAGRDVRVALPADRDKRRMKAVIDALEAGDVEGDLGAAVALAVSRMKQQGGRKQIVVISDGNLAKPAPLASDAVPIEMIRVGEPLDNAAIVRVDVRAGTDPLAKGEQVQAFLLVANLGERSRELYVTMRQRNASDVLASRRVLVEAGARAPVVLTFRPSPADYGSGLIFELSPHDALKIDDVAFGRVPAGRKLPVYAAGDEEPSPWLVRALVSDAEAEVRAGTLTELMGNAEVPADALVVVDGACRADLPGGDLLLVNPPAGDCFGAAVGEILERPMITSWEQADPRMRFLTLDGVHVAAARLLQPVSKRQALIRSDRGPIAADASTSSRGVTLLGFDVGDSDWPLQASFVLFVRNVMEQARLHRSSGMSGPATAGDPLRLTVPQSVQEARVETPDGAETTVKVRGGLVIVPEVQRTGLYRVSWSEPRPGALWVPVNLTSAAESDLRTPPSAEAIGADAKVTAAGAEPASHRRWSWLLGLTALLFILFDVWYLTRRARAPRLADMSKPIPPRRREVVAR